METSEKFFSNGDRIRQRSPNPGGDRISQHGPSLVLDSQLTYPLLRAQSLCLEEGGKFSALFSSFTAFPYTRPLLSPSSSSLCGFLPTVQLVSDTRVLYS